VGGISGDRGDQQAAARPLHLAVRNGNISAISALVKCPKVDPNIKDESTGLTPIHEAVLKGDVSIIEAFGADRDRVDLCVPDERVSGGNTCVDAALQSRNEAVLAALISLRRNDVVERLLTRRTNSKITWLIEIEEENMAMAAKIGLRPRTDSALAAEDSFSMSQEVVVEYKVLALEDYIEGGGEDGEQEPTEEEKGPESNEEEDRAPPPTSQEVIEAEESAAAVDSLQEPVEVVTATEEDLANLERSDALVRLVLANVSGLVGLDSHAHACFFEGLVYRDIC
jgi:hypothetical protein